MTNNKIIKFTIVAAVIVALAVFLVFAGTEQVYASGEKEITSKEQLNSEDITIAVGQGGYAEQVVEKELPKAKRMYMNHTDGYQAVAQGKADAFIYDRDSLELAVENGLEGVRILDEDMDEANRIAVGISPVTSIEDLKGKLDTFIREKKEDGTLDDMYDRWVIKKEEEMPQIEPAKDPKIRLRVGTTGIVPPFSYYKDQKLCGYDIELAYRFAAWLGADLEFRTYDFGGMVTAAAAGEVDCLMSELNVTPEREEALEFSDILFEEYIGIMVRAPRAVSPEIRNYDDLAGKRVAMLTGAPFEELIKSRAPDVGSFTYYNNISDMLLALRSGRIDAFLNNNAIADLVINRNPDMALFPEELDNGVFGFAFAKGDKERDKWQAAIDSIPEKTVQETWEKWTGRDDAKKILPKQDWPGKNGTVKVAACDTIEPACYLGDNGQLAGFDIELILLAAKELDVHVEFTGMEFSSVLSYVQSGKALFGCGSIIATDERRETMDFAEYYPAAFVLIVRASSGDDKEASFFEKVKTSFEKNYIREDRWKMFLKGILVTVLITALAMIFGTALGFVLFLLCKDGGRIANAVTGAFGRLIQGMPMVVLLMILYYIVFKKIDIGGVMVSVIAFSMTFGLSVYGLLKVGVGAVDKGQYEAAYALGYSVNRTFFRIILPQALPHVMDSYRAETVSLIKATAIVGYIAVQDLTKIGDIVRSRTYEAFFPLIAIAVIYFGLEALFGFAVSRIFILSDPKTGMRRGVLKGVKLNDQD